MPDGIIILGLLILFVLGCLAASLFGKRLRALAVNDWATRYRRLRWVTILYGILFLMWTVSAFQRHGQFVFKQLLSPASFALCFGIFFYQCLQARRKMLAQPDFVRQKWKPLPSFFWQAILILLPVTLMAGFGFWAILRERNAVEHEAQQRAREILQALPEKFGRIAASRLTDFQLTKNGWDGYLGWAISAWPENKTRKQWLADTNNSQMLTNRMATMRSVFPEWPAGPVAIVSFYLDANGDLSLAHEMPPRPPTWLAMMSIEQHQAWATLLQTAAAAGSLSNVVKAFEQTQPSPSALACAEFLQLRAESATLSATNALEKLIRFGNRHWNDISETGVPLKTLALAEALKRAQDCGPTEPLWELLHSEIVSPNVLTPMLLDEAARLVAKDAQLSEAIKAMRILLADRQAECELADAVKQTRKLNGITTTNLWVDALSQRWFCILSPSALNNHTSISNHPVTTITPITQVWCYPRSLVASGFSDALKNAKISLPDYFGISIKLEGQPIPLPAPWNNLGDGKPAGDILAEGRFQMAQEAGISTGDSDSGMDAFFLAMPGSRREGNNIFFDDLPSHPEFSMQIRLADRPRLYAKQRQLQFIFGSLIAVSTLAALIGFIAAYRAFRREQQLGVMKSNFVSSVSHELRAPIASVRLMAENLECGKVSDPARQDEYFRFIGQECRRLSALIENVLDFSRIEQGRKQYEFEPTDLVALAQTTVKLMEPYAAEKGVKLEISNVQPQTSNLEWNVDGRAIQQALVNLMDNAIKHSAKGQTVTLEIGPESRCSFNLSVSDHGPGIPIAEQEKIFERFYRLGSELRRETQGIGIGLSIVKHIVEAHGGHVTVKSEPGQGSRFTIVLPAKK
jgi:signal transduction histidine kinase